VRYKDWFREEKKKQYMVDLVKWLEIELREKEVAPPPHQYFRAIQMTPYEKTKVIILGSEPYSETFRSAGLAYGVAQNQRITVELRNIFRELRDDCKRYNTDETLESWAEQGVLLLNNTLSVREGVPGSHTNIGWETFTGNYLKLLSRKARPLVFLLWGKQAKARLPFITGKHLVLQAAAPSRFTAHYGFFGCKHFTKTNAFLKAHNMETIKW